MSAARSGRGSGSAGSGWVQFRGADTRPPFDKQPTDAASPPDTVPADVASPGPAPPSLTSETRQTQWRRANLSKYRAHLAVQRALATGRLHKGPCEVCGATTVDAHHDRYDQPLVVRWLCRTHHARLHLYGEDMFPVGRPPQNPAIKRQK